MGIKSIVYKGVKGLGLLNLFLKVNFWSKQLLGIRHKDFERLREFYRAIIKPNDLVFDIGTNVGNRAEVFLALGARVVCLEPNPKLVSVLKARFGKNKNVTIVPAGCGAEPGSMEFQIGDNHLVSTFSREFIEHKIKSGEGRSWLKPIVVDVVTLDEVISKNQKPSFCKIDVEGFEKEVLQGLSTKIGKISFEFTSPSFNDDSLWCLFRLHELGYREFNVSFGESLKFEFAQWVALDAIQNFILNDERMKATTYGDFYAQ